MGILNVVTKLILMLGFYAQALVSSQRPSRFPTSRLNEPNPCACPFKVQLAKKELAWHTGQAFDALNATFRAKMEAMETRAHARLDQLKIGHERAEVEMHTLRKLTGYNVQDANYFTRVVAFLPDYVRIGEDNLKWLRSRLYPEQNRVGSGHYSFIDPSTYSETRNRPRSSSTPSQLKLGQSMKRSDFERLRALAEEMDCYYSVYGEPGRSGSRPRLGRRKCDGTSASRKRMRNKSILYNLESDPVIRNHLAQNVKIIEMLTKPRPISSEKHVRVPTEAMSGHPNALKEEETRSRSMASRMHKLENRFQGVESSQTLYSDGMEASQHERSNQTKILTALSNSVKSLQDWSAASSQNNQTFSKILSDLESSISWKITANLSAVTVRNNATALNLSEKLDRQIALCQDQPGRCQNLRNNKDGGAKNPPDIQKFTQLEQKFNLLKNETEILAEKFKTAQELLGQMVKRRVGLEAALSELRRTFQKQKSRLDLLLKQQKVKQADGGDLNNTDAAGTTTGEDRSASLSVCEDLARNASLLETWLVKVGVVIPRMASKFKHDLEGAKVLHTDQRNVVESSAALMTPASLHVPVRINFRKNFTSAPHVTASVSGLAVAVNQTNFITFQIRYIRDVNTAGFTIRVDDGRGVKRAAYQWLQIEWLAIGY